jgi:hypothetical protein
LLALSPFIFFPLLQGLRHFDATRCASLTGDLGDLALLRNLEHVGLSRCPFVRGDVGIALAEMPRLQWLGLAGCTAVVGDLGVALAHKPRLAAVDVGGCCQLTGSLACLEAAPHLEVRMCEGQPISGTRILTLLLFLSFLFCWSTLHYKGAFNLIPHFLAGLCIC